MIKYFNLLAGCILFFSSFTASHGAAAQYRATAVTPAFEQPFGLAFNGQPHQIDSNRVVFLADINGNVGYHVFNADTQETTFLIQQIAVSNSLNAPRYFQFGNRAIIEYLGSVFITDGTPSGKHY